MSQQRYFKEDHLLVKELRDQGKNLRQVGAMLGLSRSTVSWLSRHGQNLKMRSPLIPAAIQEAPKPEGEFFEHDPYYKF